ncbi:OHCU decarboxylase [Arboricoccus pini]|uniref:2-oxo-4-hydroxy-4-carboxy-5-ureidoimidazoline decarboxylase n=1 Tax=Arboricoccus pini TaxID=1963835 RepID=A0A212PW51_9PROT|nr:2-oxo-4-hydroxy-4-carboxy-5-ureidoimidazoline decarboxylase [Arboricoccus pini]SNB51150.1 OHCU decarboxylase [Arboricoccus pini]
MTSQASQLTKEEFLAKVGHVFEHSPWVAEAAWDRGLVTDAHTALGVHRALCGAFRSVSPERRMQVLRSHPDLAGRLALLGGLTAHSAAEQADAGLDACTPKELTRFAQLNDYYTRRFGFPFIIAVRGKTRNQILSIFEDRAANTPEDEFEIACDEVERIALLRLKDILP